MRSNFFPCKCCFRSSRKRITSVAVCPPAIVRMKSFDRLPPGVVVITPTMVSFFHDPDERRYGVCPLIAQVVRTFGFSEMPDSSSNPSRKPCFSAHFFLFRKRFEFPVGDGSYAPLSASTLWFLQGQSQSDHRSLHTA